MHTLKALGLSLDAHSTYFSPEEALEMRTSLEKQFEGIGVVLREGIDGVVITDLVDGGPAKRCGKLNPGDQIEAIDGKSTREMTYSEVLNAMKGVGRKRDPPHTATKKPRRSCRGLSHSRKNHDERWTPQIPRRSLW